MNTIQLYQFIQLYKNDYKTLQALLSNETYKWLTSYSFVEIALCWNKVHNLVTCLHILDDNSIVNNAFNFIGLDADIIPNDETLKVEIKLEIKAYYHNGDIEWQHESAVMDYIKQNFTPLLDKPDNYIFLNWNIEYDSNLDVFLTFNIELR